MSSEILFGFLLKLRNSTLLLSSIHLQNLNMSTKAPLENAIRRKLTTNLNATHLDVINESYMHSVPKGSETHFKVIVVSEIFSGLSLIKRHRLIHDLLKDEFHNGIHALSIVAKTPDQWLPTEKPEPSPPCKGGFGL